jgi:hypothetical protein
MDIDVKALVGQIAALFLALPWHCSFQRAPSPGFQDEASQKNKPTCLKTN